MVLWCCLADGYKQSEAYRECIGHLFLSIHRFEESQVADYPSWGQVKDRCIVIKHNLHQGVFRLSTEILKKLKWTKKRKEKKGICYHSDMSVSSFFPRPQLWGWEKSIKQYSMNCGRVERVIGLQVSHQSLKGSGKRAVDGTTNWCFLTWLWQYEREERSDFW